MTSLAYECAGAGAFERLATLRPSLIASSRDSWPYLLHAASLSTVHGSRLGMAPSQAGASIAGARRARGPAMVAFRTRACAI